jgi:hypothetical protein
MCTPIVAKMCIPPLWLAHRLHIFVQLLAFSAARLIYVSQGLWLAARIGVGFEANAAALR